MVYVISIIVYFINNTDIAVPYDLGKISTEWECGNRRVGTRKRCNRRVGTRECSSR